MLNKIREGSHADDDVRGLKSFADTDPSYWPNNIVKVFLKSDSHLPKKRSFYLLQRKLFKNDEKCFIFHVKSSFCSQDIHIFVLTLWLCRRNSLIRMMRLISNFLTSQHG